MMKKPDEIRLSVVEKLALPFVSSLTFCRQKPKKINILLHLHL
jgi:hypothetical protein